MTKPLGVSYRSSAEKDGTARLCVDYRRLNGATVRDAYPFPSIDSILSSLGSARVFTTLDCSRGFLQIEMEPSDIPKTAFTCYKGLFEFVCMPFGLKNSPSSFQRLMDIVLDDTRYKFAMAYMDDVVIFSRNFEEHLEHLSIVLQKMQKAGLTVNPKKVQLACSRVDLLGFIVGDGHLRPNDAKLRAIAEYPCPHDVEILQRFLGMIAFYRAFIPRCAELTVPLNQLVRKGVKWSWGEHQQRAFRPLNSATAETASLKLPDLNKPFVLQTDASDYGLGAVLLQEFDNLLQP